MADYREFLTSPLIRFIAALGLIGVILTVLYYDNRVTIIGLASGALVYAGAEYLVHRYLLHEFPKLAPALYRGHVKHHQHPRELKYLFSPVHYDALIYSVYIPLVWLVFQRFAIVVAVVTGSLLFQIYYQWMHFVAHRPITPRTAWGKWMKKKHLLHHYKDEYSWYGVSHPVLDFVFGTNKDHRRSIAEAGADQGSSPSANHTE